jgi:hypothetical protein
MLNQNHMQGVCMLSDQRQSFVNEVYRKLPKGCTISQTDVPGAYVVMDGYMIVGGIQFKSKGPSYWCVQGKEELPIVVQVKQVITDAIKAGGRVAA